MKKTTTILFLLIIGLFLTAQQQMQNPGFESWEEIGYGPDILEPVNWSAIKSSDNTELNPFAPVVCERSDDAHSGNFSAKLTNKATLGVVATGTMTNGRLHADLNPDLGYAFTDPDNSKWNTPFTGKPDSVVGWFKADPTSIDFGTIKFLLHKGYASIPGDEENYIAVAELNLPSQVVNQWTRFSAPFVYTSNDQPEFILSIITSGNGVNAIDGSIAYFDDFELIYNPQSVNEQKIKPLKAYQNNNKLVILFPANTHNQMEVKVTSVNGQVLYNSVIDRQNSHEIDIQNLKSGLYIITATINDDIFMSKVIINKN